jgi:hypothetical protein
MVVGNTIDCWAKRVMDPETGKAALLICLAQAVLSQLLVLKCFSVLIPSLARIDTSQFNNWHSVFQSAEEVQIISFEILDI